MLNNPARKASASIITPEDGNTKPRDTSTGLLSRARKSMRKDTEVTDEPRDRIRQYMTDIRMKRKEIRDGRSTTKV